MNRQNRLQVAKALRAAANVLALNEPRELQSLVKVLETKFPKTKFTIETTARDAQITYRLKSSDLPNRDVMTISEWPQQDGSSLFDVSVIDDPYGRGMMPVLHGGKRFPSYLALVKMVGRIKVSIGQLPDSLPADVVIKKVEVKPYTVDEWVGLDIRIRGNWQMRTNSYDATPEMDRFAKQVFQMALPEIQKQAEKWSGQGARVREHGSSLSDEPLVEKAIPSVRSFADVGQVDFDGDTILYSISDR